MKIEDPAIPVGDNFVLHLFHRKTFMFTHSLFHLFTKR